MVISNRSSWVELFRQTIIYADGVQPSHRRIGRLALPNNSQRRDVFLRYCQQSQSCQNLSSKKASLLRRMDTKHAWKKTHGFTILHSRRKRITSAGNFLLEKSSRNGVCFVRFRKKLERVRGRDILNLFGKLTKSQTVIMEIQRESHLRSQRQYSAETNSRSKKHVRHWKNRILTMTVKKCYVISPCCASENVSKIAYAE